MSLADRLVTRKEWGAVPPRSRTALRTPRGNTAHYEGPRMGEFPHSECIGRVQGIQSFHMNTRGWNDIAYCVSEDTEILTSEGWRTYAELTTDDLVLTLNHETGRSEWQPVLEVCAFDPPAGGREMVSMEGVAHSSLSTPDHRWPVERRKRSDGSVRLRDVRGRWSTRVAPTAPKLTVGFERRFVTSETIGYWDQVPIAAQCADLPRTAKYSDALVELVAWFWTEGHIMRNRAGRRTSNLGICQSWERNPQNVARIDAALRDVFGPPVSSMPRIGPTTDGVPRWRRYTNGQKEEFWLSVDAGEQVLRHAPGRIPAYGFLLSLTEAQLRLFIDVSLLTDRSGPRSLAQKSREAAEAFQFAATLAGFATSIRARPPTSSTPYEMWLVRLRSNTHFAPGPAKNARSGRFSVSRQFYDGRVWCPRTSNQTWLARRNGTVYFTGNSSVYCPHGAVFEGRWLGVRTAAQGTNEGNATHYAHCYLGGQGDPLTAEGRAAFKDILSFFRANGSGPELRSHQSWHATACPGQPLLAFIEEKLANPGMFTPPPVGPGGVPAAVGFMARPGGGGWIVAADGGVFSIGTTPFFQSMAGHPHDGMVGGAGTPSGQGYWLVDRTGHVFAFGDAPHLGPHATLTLNAPIVAMAGTREGDGYWLVGADGGVFAFGQARFIDSLSALSLNDPIVALAAGQAAGGRRNRSEPGYLLVGADGGVFPFGTDFFGSMADHPLRAPIVSVAATPTGDGYWLFAADGGVFAFGDAPFRGVHAALAGEWERGERRVMGASFVGNPANRATWGYELYSDRLPVERYRFVPSPKR